ncbi:hypothetical protein AAFC00_001309 [Neodothiora populina]|uniref:Cytidine deaminase-like protein n=1 Tax=Neodothiora populina TaxID=2781224 RepID=A0ABR3PNH9_9PEZI
MPPAGLLHLKTRAENRAQTDTIQVWTLELPAKAANHALNFLKENIKDQDSIDLQHLRRFAKARFLPAHLLPERSQSRSPSTGGNNGDAPQTTASSRSRSNRRRRNSGPATLHMLICPTRFIDKPQLSKLLEEVSPFWEATYPLVLREVEVPLLAPTSPEQSELWSQKYWPTMYRKTNPFGPHPSIVSKAEEELKASDNIPRAMGLAKRVAAETKAIGCGEQMGCIIIERPAGKAPEIVAVAGDARYKAPNGADYVHPNVMSHAVMRAIGMVARKRVRIAAKKPEELDDNMAALDLNKPAKAPAPDAPKSVPEALLDYPLTPLESNAFEQDNIVANGYLCVELEVYLTHEPCMMCSMAILHSRFARCIFGQRMPKTGAMVADDGLGYGLFWRPELNWKLLCWEVRESEDDEEAEPLFDEDLAV